MSLSLKIFLLACLSALLLSLNAYYYADYQTTLLPGVYITSGPSDIEVNNWSVPLVFDWNNDGRNDLLVGSSFVDDKKAGHGYVSYYKNIGSNESPLFNGSSLLQACNEKCSPLSVAAFG